MKKIKRHNPEKKAWKGKSYRKNGERIADLREKARKASDTEQEKV